MMGIKIFHIYSNYENYVTVITLNYGVGLIKGTLRCIHKRVFSGALEIEIKRNVFTGKLKVYYPYFKMKTLFHSFLELGFLNMDKQKYRLKSFAPPPGNF